MSIGHSNQQERQFSESNAVGTTFRRLVSKIACARISDKAGSDLKPTQLGFGTKGGVEAGVHAARNFVNSGHSSIEVFMKLYYKNAFNELERDPMLLVNFPRNVGKNLANPNFQGDAV